MGKAFLAGIVSVIVASLLGLPSPIPLLAGFAVGITLYRKLKKASGS